jgi:hypothetical protein
VHATRFSKLDCLLGYHQVLICEEDRTESAFCTPFGNFEFCVVPFGLCGAPATISYFLDEVFRDPAYIAAVKVDFNTFIAVYLDDICPIYGYTGIFSAITYHSGP